MIIDNLYVYLRYLLVILAALYAAILAWLVYPAAALWVYQRFICRHGGGMSFTYTRLLPSAADRPIVETRCMRCGKVEQSAVLVSESPSREHVL